MNKSMNDQKKIVRVYQAPAYIGGAFIRMVEYEGGELVGQKWEESDGWVDCNVSLADFWEADPISKEEMRELGMPEEQAGDHE